MFRHRKVRIPVGPINRKTAEILTDLCGEVVRIQEIRAWAPLQMVDVAGGFHITCDTDDPAFRINPILPPIPVLDVDGTANESSDDFPWPQIPIQPLPKYQYWCFDAKVKVSLKACSSFYIRAYALSYWCFRASIKAALHGCIYQPIVTTKGDIYTYSTRPIRLPVGSNGLALLADSTQATGLNWGSPSVGPQVYIQTGTTVGYPGYSITITGGGGAALIGVLDFANTGSVNPMNVDITGTDVFGNAFSDTGNAVSALADFHFDLNNPGSSTQASLNSMTVNIYDPTGITPTTWKHVLSLF